MNDPYTTVEFAKDYNKSDEWLNLSSAQKLDALKWGRLYMDGKYSCPDIDALEAANEVIPDNVQIANAIYAELYVQGYLFKSTQDLENQGYAKERELIKAGPVMIEEEFDTMTAYDVLKTVSAKADALMAPYCNKTTKNVVFLTR